MTTTLPISKARDELATLVDNARTKLSEYIITVNGSPAAVLLSAAEYESWKETLDILSDPNLTTAIKEGEADIAAGRVHDWEQVKKELQIGVHPNTHRQSKKRAQRHL